MKDKKSPEIRVRGVSENLKRDLNNIAKNKGISLTSFLKPILRDIVNSASDKDKKEPPKD